MSTQPPKSSVDEIRQRFDNDVERFSNLESGQSAAVDSKLCIDLIGAAAVASTPHATRLLDVGCGAGNFSLALLARLPQLEVTLVDLSQPMLDRAVDRLNQAGCRAAIPIQTDIRTFALDENRFDIIVAAAVLHHLRTETEWLHVFTGFHRALAPGGSLWIYDLVDSPTLELHKLSWQQYGQQLVESGGPKYRDRVFAYIEQEDTPAPLVAQLEWLRQAGFSCIDVLHKHACFAAFGAIK